MLRPYLPTSRSCLYWLHYIVVQIASLIGCSYMLLGTSGVESGSQLSLIQCSLEAYYVFLKTSYFSWLSCSSPFTQQQVVAPQTPQAGLTGSESSQTTDAVFNLPQGRTKQQCRQQLVHCDTANAATTNIIQDAHWMMDLICRSRKHIKKQMIECYYIQPRVDCGQQTIQYTAGVRRDPWDQFVTTNNVQPPWSMNAIIHTVCKIEHEVVVSSRISLDSICN